MAFQALAWAWKIELSDPIERCVLLWMTGRCSPNDNILFGVPVGQIAVFAGCDDDQVIRAIAALQEKNLVKVSADFQFAKVQLPEQLLEEVAPGEWEYVHNKQPVPETLREEVLRAYNRTCFACGSKSDPHVDHIIPRKQGGQNIRENLQVLCADCNIRKRDKAGWVSL